MRALAAALLVASVPATFGAATAQAETRTLRCKNDLINVGDTKAEVLMKCGEPAVRDTSCQTPSSRNAYNQGTRPRPDLACVTVDEWTYRPGYGQLITTLRFEENRLQSIAYGDRQ